MWSQKGISRAVCQWVVRRSLNGGEGARFRHPSCHPHHHRIGLLGCRTEFSISEKPLRNIACPEECNAERMERPQYQVLAKQTLCRRDTSLRFGSGVGDGGKGKLVRSLKGHIHEEARRMIPSSRCEKRMKVIQGHGRHQREHHVVLLICKAHQAAINFRHTRANIKQKQ